MSKVLCLNMNLDICINIRRRIIYQFLFEDGEIYSVNNYLFNCKMHLTCLRFHLVNVFNYIYFYLFEGAKVVYLEIKNEL